MAYLQSELAESMHEKFKQKWESFHDMPLPPETRNERMMIFEAIAETFLEHLRDNAEESIIIQSDTHSHNATVHVGTTDYTVNVSSDTHNHSVNIEVGE